MAKIKISKVAKDLNIALPTVIDFLQSKGINVDMNPNSRIDEDAYKLLVSHYGDDKAVKKLDETDAAVRQTEKNKEIEKERPTANIITPKVIGHIDLDARKPVVKKEPEPVKKQPEPAKTQEPVKKDVVVEKKPEPAKVKPEPVKVQPKTEPVPEVKKEPEATVKIVKDTKEESPKQKPMNKVEELKKDVKPAPEVRKTVDVQPEVKNEEPKKAEPEIFTTGPITGAPQLNVVGKIDLSAINQQTRPKKKTKEERRNERLAKNGPGNNGFGTAQGQGQGSCRQKETPSHRQRKS